MFMVASSLSAVGSVHALVGVLYVFDLFFRKRNTKSNVWFGLAWVFTFGLGASFAGAMVLLDPTDLYLTVFLATIYFIPFLLNTTYLYSLMTPKSTR